jgi:GxxExxY protein
MLVHGALTEKVIGLAIDVHRRLGPGLLESVYGECLAFELADAGVGFQRQLAIPVVYRDRLLEAGFRADIVIADELIVEIKSIDAIHRVHEAQPSPASHNPVVFRPLCVEYPSPNWAHCPPPPCHSGLVSAPSAAEIMPFGGSARNGMRGESKSSCTLVTTGGVFCTLGAGRSATIVRSCAAATNRGHRSGPIEW